MKKKLIGLMLVLTMTASLVACGKKSEKKDEDTSFAAINAEEYAGTVTKNAGIYKKYASLPEYKGIEIETDLSSYVVTEEKINSYIKEALEYYSTVEKITEGQTKKGDTIQLDYSGTLDGVAFSGGTATDVTYEIGSGKYIADLDNGLAGITVGETVDIPCKFPETYASADLAGKDVIFTVTVKNIQKEIIPDLTDDWVKANSKTIGLEASTVDEFNGKVKTYLEEEAKSNMATAKYQAVYNKIKDDIKVTDFPSKELNVLLETLNNNVKKEFEQNGATYNITSLDDYIVNVYGFEDKAAFDEYSQTYAKDYMTEKMFLTIVADENNITVTADEIKDTGAELASYYGYDSYQEILDEYGLSMNSEIGYQVLYQKVVEFVASEAKVTDKAN